jgi:hypothetical protein
MLYYLNLVGALVALDGKGVALSSLAEAQREAVLYLAQLLREQPGLVWSGHDVQVEVTDANRLALFSVTVSASRVPSP